MQKKFNNAIKNTSLCQYILLKIIRVSENRLLQVQKKSV